MFLLLALLAVTGASSPTLADGPKIPKNYGPEVIDLKMGIMILPFQHKKHQKSLNNECYLCHKTVDGKIDGWGREVAHTICIPCHDLYEKGPIECRQCHRK